MERLARLRAHVAQHSDATAAGGKLVVGYWDIRGLGAPLRMLCCFAGADYEPRLYSAVPTEDGGLDRSVWEAEKARLAALNPLVNLPYVLDGGVLVAQSNACLAYLGRKFGLMGQDSAEASLAEQCLAQVMDLRNAAIPVFYSGDLPADGPAHLDDVAGHYAKLDAWLEDGASAGRLFLAAASPTAPDFHLWEMLDQHTRFCAFYGFEDPLRSCPHLLTYEQRFRALPELRGYFAGPLHQLPLNNKSAVFGATPNGGPWPLLSPPGAVAGTDPTAACGGFEGIEEIFLDVEDLGRALSFYRDTLGMALERHDDTRAFLQLSSSHVVLQRSGSGSHRGAGPCHFAFCVTDEKFDELAGRVSKSSDSVGGGGVANGKGGQRFNGLLDGEYRTRGPMGSGSRGRALFIYDPDGNEMEVNTRYMHRPVWGAGGIEL